VLVRIGVANNGLLLTVELVWIAQASCLTAPSLRAMIVLATHEIAMRAQAFAHKTTIDRLDLETLDEFLRSDRPAPGGMTLSELDGFITGIAIGPELIRPGEWLPLIWGGDAPEFAAMDEAKAILGSLMARYDEIVRDVADDALAPIFWEDRDGTVIAIDWAEGFFQAIQLRPDAWKPLFTCKRNGHLLVPILSLCGDENGGSLLGLPPHAEDRLMQHAPELIPSCVIGIAAYWRKQPRQIAGTSKVGRNDPCPCGSGRKFKRCCGQVAWPAV